MDESSDTYTRESARAALESAAEGSRVIEFIRRVPDTVVDSRLGAMAAFLGTATRSSFLYRWLTKEPDPEVVVIDLRETWTVGPLVRALEWSIERVEPYWEASGLRSMLERVETLLSRLAQTRVGRVLRTLLEPPDPPE